MDGSSMFLLRILLEADKVDPRHWPITSYELLSMARRDVPRFSAHTEGSTVNPWMQGSVLETRQNTLTPVRK